MPSNGFSIGRDLSYTVVTYSGTLTLNGKTSYAPKPIYTDLKHKGLDGVTIHGVIPDGWEIDFKFDRTDPNVDLYFAQLEADYYAGVNQTGGTVYESTQEKDGSITSFRYTNVVLKYDTAGDWKGDSLISISVKGMGSRRFKV